MRKFLLAGILLASTTSYSQITITPGGGVAGVSANLFGPGVTISGMTINCPGAAYGSFTGPLGTSGMTSGGIVLTTGSAAGADGPNNTGSGGVCNSTGGNAVLAAAQPMPGGYFDACTIEFDLVPQCGTLSINFCFGSEEYPEWVSSPYNDGFGIFVSGPNPAGGSYTNYNMARLPSGQIVSIDNVNAGVNPTFYNTNASGIMQYDGYTDGLVANLTVTPCASYHFIITIADAGDCVYDSGVFLQFQGLFCSVPSLAATTTANPTTCGGANGSASVTVTTGTGPFTYSWTNAAGTVIGTGTSVSGLAAGTYTITTNDGSPCTPPLVQTVIIAPSAGPTVTPTAETCSGYNNGQVIINNAPGAGPYTVTINGPATATVIEANTAAATATFTSLPDGNYTYTVTGSGGCTNSGTFTIGAGPACCSVTATGVNPACFGGTTGTVTANPTGLAGFGYSWNTTPVQITQTASGLPSGTYTVTMTDASGCTATANVTINQPTQISGTSVNVNPLCNGGSTGSITMNAAGGTGTLTYSINGGPFVSSNVFSGLPAGTHTIIVKDANGCTRTFTVTLTDPPAVGITLVGTTPATCGSSNGTITVSGTGGTGAYTFSTGGPFVSSGSFTGLAANTYTVTVHDVNGCAATVSAIVGSSSGPSASVISQTNVSCAGGANGSVLLGAAGGTPTITYSIDLAGPTPATPFQASNSFTGLAAGTYTATVKDGNGCTGTVNFTITAPTALTYTTVASPASCNGVCDGQIAVNIPVGSGTGPYQYSSNNGLSFGPSSPLTGLCAGNIFVVVKDANGCLSNAVVNIAQPAPITATYALTNPTCPDICNGQIQVNSVAGGSIPYQYSVNGGPLQFSNSFTGLCNGNSTVLIQDNHGCQLTSVQMLVDPPAFTVTQTVSTESNCGFNNGGFEVVASGGFPLYSYNNITLGIVQATGAFNSLVAGSYEIEVTDAHGCVQTFFAGINDVEMDGTLDGLTNASCHGVCDGTVLTHATGGFAPIQYDLDGSGSFEFDGDYTGLCAGNHIVLMADNGFCIYTIPFTIVEPAEIFFNVATTNVACNGGNTGSITVNTVTGGNGVYQYSINGGPLQASPTFGSLTDGTYNITVQDGNGCTGIGTATVNEATPITFTTNIVDLTCAGNNTGFFQIVASGGTGALQYTPNNGVIPFSPLFTFAAQPAGTYNFAVTDAAGCIVTGTAVIAEPAPLAAAYVLSPALCNGSCDGTITVSASGGTTPYFYSDDNGTTYQVSNILQDLCAGTYQVMVRDSNFCLVGSSITVNEPTVITYTTVVTNSTCSGANGVIDFNPASGGTPNYLYNIGTGFVTGTNFPGLSAGTYNLTVQDNNLCEIDATVTIVDEASPVINAVFTTDPLCFNDCNGTATINASGGTGGIQYSIDGGAPQVSNIITGICAGAHVVEIIDGNGCTDTQNINLANPTQVSFTTNVTDLTCYQNSTGAIAITASGGTGVYTYSYNNGGSFTASSTNNSIPAGIYDLIVSDGNSCTATATVTVAEPPQLVFTAVTVTDAVCAGVCDGTISVTVTGGTVAGGYTYAWGGAIAGPTASNATSVCVGTYAIIVNDDNNCIIDTVVAVNEPAPVAINSVVVTDALCSGSCDGIVTINAPTGAQYSAVITGNAPVFGASNVIGGLCAGNYDIAVQDGAGCPASTTTIVLEPDPLNMVATENSTVCYASNFELSANATGGTLPYNYLWSNSFNGPAQSVNPTALTNYDVTVTDDHGCTFGPVTVTVDVIPQLTATLSPDVTICPGDQATFTATAASGLAPYHYFWQTTPVVDAASLTVTPPGPGAYTVLVIDQCTDTVSLTGNVLWYNAPNMTLVSDNPDGCSPLVANFTANFGGGFVSTACAWDFGNGTTGAVCSPATATYIEPGCYDVTLSVTSPEGCVFDSTFNDVACVYPDPIVDFVYNPVNANILQPEVNFVNLTLNGVSYNWNFAGLDSSQLQHPSFNFNQVEAGTYMVCLEVVSNQGCTGDTCKPVIIHDDILIYVPNAFTPDADGVNDIFLPSVKGVEAEGYELLIFDRWGELIFMTTDKLKGWDGQFKSVQVKEDVYVWKIKAKLSETEDVKEYRGHVTLLR